jgi:hypothetical protein
VGLSLFGRKYFLGFSLCFLFTLSLNTPVVFLDQHLWKLLDIRPIANVGNVGTLCFTFYVDFDNRSWHLTTVNKVPTFGTLLSSSEG